METLLRAAETIATHKGTLVLVRDRSSFQYLKSQAQRRKLDNIAFVGMVSLSEAT